MATGNKITINHIRGFTKEISVAKTSGKDAFFTWFNSSKDAEESFVRGAWDFSYHIAFPISKYLKNPEAKTVLEIGHGGGRMLAAAASHFSKAIGIDVHDENPYVMGELIKRGIRNVVLIKGDGSHIPVGDSSADVVYSFIVLQHVEKIAILKSYIKETFRVLKPGGTAILYFGRYGRFSKGNSSLLLYIIDQFLGMLILRNGYREITSKVNDINLILSLDYVKDLSRVLGFEILGQVVSRFRVPDGVNLYGGQHGLVLKKP